MVVPSADPTGRRFLIGTGTVTAEITEVGASLRSLRIGGLDVVPGYPEGMPTPAAAGVVLAPWPNRVRDGVWRQQGQEHHLALTEPALGNASHGLLRFTAYRVLSRRRDRVTLGAVIYPQTGYPFHVASSVRYRVHANGLDVRHEMTAVGVDAAPVAVGAHPYLEIAGWDMADLLLQVDAERWYPTDSRKLPLDPVPVDAAHDLRSPRRVGDLDLDTCYTDLARDDDDCVRVRLMAPGGPQVTLWGGSGIRHVQVFTTSRFPGRALALAVEPMSAPPDALNSGVDLRWLSPGESWRTEWGVTCAPGDERSA